MFSRTHSVGLDGGHYTAILVWPEEMAVAVDPWLERWADHEHQTVWEVEAEGAALLETGIGLHPYLTFPALVAKVELEVVRRSPVMPISAVEADLAWQ